jgi:enoyl-CoA hydratase/carnithine racemase
VLALVEECFGTHIASVEQALRHLDQVGSGALALTSPALPASTPSTPLDATVSSAQLRVIRAPLGAEEAAAMATLAKKIAADLRLKSPIALKTTFRALRENASKHLGDALTTEFRLGLRMTSHHDFKEGVRALLIDKDNKPQWNPKSLEEVLLH